MLISVSKSSSILGVFKAAPYDNDGSVTKDKESSLNLPGILIVKFSLHSINCIQIMQQTL